MLNLLLATLATARSSLRSRGELALENLALRQQLAVLERRPKRPKLTRVDRAFWVALSRLWPKWRTALMLVRPETVIGWHRKGFALYWTWKSPQKGGRPRKDAELRSLIRQMATANVGWGAPRIHGELLKLGFEVSQATVSRNMPRPSKPPSQTWRTFLANHMRCAAAIDFFVVPTATFQLFADGSMALGERAHAIAEAIDRIGVGAHRRAGDQLDDHHGRGEIGLVEAPQVSEVEASELGRVPPCAQQRTSALRAAAKAFR